MQDFKIVIVDDCSTDNSCAVVGNFFVTFGERFERSLNRYEKISCNNNRGVVFGVDSGKRRNSTDRQLGYFGICPER
ncbi:MAG: glycosyltransferase family 2 protein [Selenomonadaceae bacterium]|nr:glycosyltransferase family 2 protein [Selenomonadaceae bacterium]